MNYKEYKKFREENKEKIINLEKEAKRVEQQYCMEALEKAGYHIGDAVTNNKGEKGIIVGVEFFVSSPRTIVAKMKKDGTSSQVTAYSLGFKIPNIEE